MNKLIVYYFVCLDLRGKKVHVTWLGPLLKTNLTDAKNFIRHFVRLRIGFSLCKNRFKKGRWIFQISGLTLELFSIIS